MPYLGIFGQKFKKKTIVIFEISTLKFHPKMLDLCVSGLEFEKKLSYLKSAPSNLSNCKIFRKKKRT